MYPRASITTTNKGPVVTGRVTEPMANAMRSWMQGVMKRVRDDVRMFAPADLGEFKKSVVYRTGRKGLAVEGEVYSSDPNTGKVAVIEYGRRPGSKMPPSGVLLGWMARRGVDPRLEFVIRRAIGRDGIPAVAPFRKAFVKNRGLLASQSRNLQSQLVRSLN